MSGEKDYQLNMVSSLDAISQYKQRTPAQPSIEHRTPTGQPSGLVEVPEYVYPGPVINPACQIRILEVLPGSLNDEIYCNLAVQEVDLKSKRVRPANSQRDITGDLLTASFVNYFAKNVTWAQTKHDLWKWAPAKYRQAHDDKLSAEHVQNHAVDSAAPAFNALSYTWGSWDDHRHISLHGQSAFPVTRNLHSALRRIRDTTGTVRLWVDALCINQHDVEERNVQVRSMGSIYSIAWDVFIWLGDVNDASIPDRSQLSGRLLRRAILSLLHEVISNAKPSWWTRAWVIQEFLMARQDPVVYFGNHEMRWTNMIELGKKVKEDKELSWKFMREKWNEDSTSKEDDPLDRVCAPFYSFSNMKYLSNAGDLASFGWAWAQTQASNPRDKVYSLLGLLGEKENALITVDYNIEVDKLYAGSTFAAIASSGNLHILQFVRSERNEVTLPTWAIDFSYSYKTADSAWFSGSDMSKYLFHEAPVPWCQIQCQHVADTSIDSSSEVLTLAGLEFDTICHTIHTNKEDYCEEFWETVVETVKSPLSFFSNHPVLLTKDEQEVWTLICNLSSDPYIALSDRAQTSLSQPPPPPQTPNISTSAAKTYMTMWSLRIFHIWSRKFLQGRGQGLDKVGWRAYGMWKAYLASLSGGDVFFITRSGFVGLGHKDARQGDRIVLPFGSRYPLLLRPRADAGAFEFMGFSYVHGIMSSELRSLLSELLLREGRFCVF